MALSRQNLFSNRKFVLAILVLIGIGFGVWEAWECATTTSGYLATYNFLAAWLIAASCGILGLGLLMFSRTRWLGGGLILVGILSCGTFYAGMTVLWKLDRVAWRHERLVPLGPDQKASAVIYFRRGVTSQQVADFDSTVLEEPSRQAPGHAHPAFVLVYLRLLPIQANGHEAIALTFSPNTPSDKANGYLAKIKADNRVENVYLDTSPDSIRGDSERP